mgnify:CR=1 FL=1
MRAIIKTKIKFLDMCYSENFYIKNNKVKQTDKADYLIEKYNLQLDFTSNLGSIYVDSDFKELAQQNKDQLIRQLEILE